MSDHIAADKKIQVLIVDDEEQIRKMISQTLAGDTNIVVTDVNSNVKACDILKEQRYDLVLLDWDLSQSNEAFETDSTGRPVLKLCRQLYPTMPVVVMSGIISVDIRPEVVSLEADSYLSKPFDINMLKQDIINKTKRSRRASEWFKFDSSEEILTMHELKRQYVIATVNYFQGKQSATAKALGVSRNTVNAILNSEPQSE